MLTEVEIAEGVEIITDKEPKPEAPKRMNKVQRHKELCKQLNRIYEAKNQDYGDAFSTAYKQFGITSALVRISDKYNRLMNLASGKKVQVKDESIRDTLLDLSNYCLLTILELDREAYNKEKFKNEESIS